MNQDKEWVYAQKKTFENWVNQSLKDKEITIEDITKDFTDTKKLYALYQQLTSLNIKNFDKKSKQSKIQVLGNLNLIIDSFKKDITLVNIQGEDIYDQNLKLILGFTWTLIKHYHILGHKTNTGEESEQSKLERKRSISAKKLLVDFVNKRIPDHPIKNFTGNWKDGIVLAKLIESIEPGVFPEEKWPENAEEKIQMSLQLAEEKMEVPKVIEANIIANAIDELSLMTYTTYLKKRFEENEKKICAANCIVTGDLLKGTLEEKDSPFKFTVELRNIYDEPCLVEMEDDPTKDVDAVFKGPASVQSAGRCTEPGLYVKEFEISSPGDYTVDIRIPVGQTQVKESPFSFTVIAEKKEFDPNTAKVKVSGEIMDKKEFPDNRPTGLIVEVEDEEGKKAPGRQINVLMTDKKKNPAGKIEVEDKGDGTYEVNIDEVTEKGEYDIDVQVDTVSKEKLKAKCNPGTQPELVTGTFTFEVQSRDKNGEPKVTGGDDWDVKVTGPKDSVIEVETKDLQNGKYTATYTLEAEEGGPSTFKVNAKLNGSHVASSPFKHELAPKPSVGQRFKNFFKR